MMISFSLFRSVHTPNIVRMHMVAGIFVQKIALKIVTSSIDELFLTSLICIGYSHYCIQSITIFQKGKLIVDYSIGS
jgi:hypothetical protein